MPDIERNGGSFEDSSILSMAVVVVDTKGRKVDEWYKKFEEREGCDGDADTHAWWLQYPDKYAEAILHSEDIKTCMDSFSAWLGALKAEYRVVWACQPVSADWPWLKFYVDKFCPPSAALPHKVWDVSTLRLGFMATFDINRESFDTQAQTWCQDIEGDAHDPRYDAYVQARVFARMLAFMKVNV